MSELSKLFSCLRTYTKSKRAGYLPYLEVYKDGSGSLSEGRAGHEEEVFEFRDLPEGIKAFEEISISHRRLSKEVSDQLDQVYDCLQQYAKQERHRHFPRLNLFDDSSGYLITGIGNATETVFTFHNFGDALSNFYDIGILTLE